MRNAFVCLCETHFLKPISSRMSWISCRMPHFLSTTRKIIDLKMIIRSILEIVNWYVLDTRAKYFLAIFLSLTHSHARGWWQRWWWDGKLTYFWKDGVNLIFSSQCCPTFFKHFRFFYIQKMWMRLCALIRDYEQ